MVDLQDDMDYIEQMLFGDDEPKVTFQEEYTTPLPMQEKKSGRSPTTIVKRAIAFNTPSD
jgi:hypothetical protein